MSSYFETARRNLLVGGVVVHVRFNGSFENISRIPRETALKSMKACRHKKIFIELCKIRTEDLCALFVIWKDLVDVTTVSITTNWNEGGDVESIRANIPVLLLMLRDPRITTKKIRINDFFMSQHFAPLFGDIVFDRANLLIEDYANGSDMPLCRHFFIDETVHDVSLRVEDSDAFIPFIQKVEFSEDRDDVATYRHFDPSKLRLIVSHGESKMEQLACIYRHVEKLNLSWSDDVATNARCIAFIRRMPLLHTLVVSWMGIASVEVPEDFVRALASLPRLRRLHLRRLNAVSFDFLLQLPRLEALRVNLLYARDISFEDISCIPLLRAIVFDGSGHSPAWTADARDKISKMRSRWMRPFIKIYRRLAHLTSDEIARMIWMMSCDEEDRAAYMEAMRSQPTCRRLDDKWKLAPRNKRKRADRR